MRSARHLIHSAAVALAVVFAPADTFADLRATAFAGGTRVNDVNKGTVGAAVTFGGLLGIEFEAARVWLGTLADLDVANIGVEATLTTYMGNMVLRVPTGGVQPYASAGVGLARVTGRINVPFIGSALSASAADIAWNVGGGVYVLPSEHLGLRADVRRFRTGDVQWDKIAGIGDLPLPTFDFWRATAGLTITF